MPPSLSLQGGRRPTWRPEREARGSALGVQSREGSCDFAGGTLSSNHVLPCPARLPRAQSALAMTHQGNALVHQRPPAIEWLCTRRSLSAATPHILAFTVLSLTCTDRQHSAGSGMPLPYNGVCDQRECLPEIATGAKRPRNDTSGKREVHQCPRAVELPRTRRSLTAATDAIGACRFNGGLYGLQVPSRDCHGRKAPSQ